MNVNNFVWNNPNNGDQGDKGNNNNEDDDKVYVLGTCCICNNEVTTRSGPNGVDAMKNDQDQWQHIDCHRQKKGLPSFSVPHPPKDVDGLGKNLFK